MADAFSQFEVLVREAISPSVVNLVLPEDDIAWQLTQSMQATRAAGRDLQNAIGSSDSGWFAEWRVRTMRGGLATGGKFGGGTMSQMGADDHLNVGSAADSLYPDPAKAALRSWVAIRMKLKRIQGNYVINKSQLISRMASGAMVEDEVSVAVEDITALIRSLFTNYLYGDGSAVIAKVNNTATITLTKGSSTAVPVDNGTAFRFVMGQRYVAGSDITPANYGSSPRVTTSGSATEPGVFRCIDIDADTRVPYFETEEGFSDVVLDDNDNIMLEGTYDFTAATVNAGTLAANGLESLLISSGNFPGAFHAGSAMAVTDHRYLKSYISGTEGDEEAPTPEVIAEIIDKITDASKAPPNVLIAEKSLWTLYAQLERQGYAQQIVPQGGLFTATGGVAAPQLGHGTASFTQFHSPRVRPGMIVGMASDTWKKFMPFGDMTIQWLYSSGAMAGTESIFHPVMSGRQATQQAQAPFDFYGEYGCDDPRRNFRRVGLSSQRSVSGG